MSKKNKNNEKNYRELIEVFNEKSGGLIKYFKIEFGEDLYSGKLILKLVSCGKKDCKFCPHGPYWYRAVFNPRTKRWMFKYIKSNLTKGMLKGKEAYKWDRYKFYNEEAKRIRKERQDVLRNNIFL
jgi:hypothetical protein